MVVLALGNHCPVKATAFPRRPTYSELAAVASGEQSVVNLLMNTDCHIEPDDMAKLDQIGWNEVWCISRTDNRCAASQDAWAWRGCLYVPEADYTQGRPGCDNRFAFDVAAAGRVPVNPALDIRVVHRHASRMRRYTEADRIPSPYLFVEPTHIGTSSRLEFRGRKSELDKIPHLQHLMADLHV
jgi:hypothetical protein